jgi:hypothetical protein
MAKQAMPLEQRIIEHLERFGNIHTNQPCAVPYYTICPSDPRAKVLATLQLLEGKGVIAKAVIPTTRRPATVYWLAGHEPASIATLLQAPESTAKKRVLDHILRHPGQSLYAILPAIPRDQTHQLLEELIEEGAVRSEMRKTRGGGQFTTVYYAAEPKTAVLS